MASPQSSIDTLTNHTVELLQQLIRNRCVNDGNADSGGERRNADLLQTYLEGAGIDVERLTPHGDRTSIVARIEGTDPNAPKLCMM
ncbi:MAG: peptidase M20 family protein, partial [Ilumatobacteraceae bacterium]|nr:peptidase M20 family protein [Ilumatobacteraceae bacterium]